jgi:hypothetical protein
MPIPPIRERPPAAEIVSVHPGTGDFVAPTIIEGRISRVGKLGFLLFLKVRSPIDLVNV